MRAHVSMLIAGLCALTSSCHQEPKVAGQTIECQSDVDCAAIQQKKGGVWRCAKSLCVTNRSPVVTIDLPDTVASGEVVTLEVSAHDADGDDLQVSMKQIQGPQPWLLPEPVQSSTEVTAIDLGWHVIEAVADDGYETTRVQGSFIVEPPGSVAFVSDLGEDSEDCGANARPCRSITHALELLREANGSPRTVALAGASQDPRYAECIELYNGETLQGCLDPFTWQESQVPCVVSCESASGHLMRGDAQLRGITLAIASNVEPADNQLTAEIAGDSLPMATLWLEAEDGRSPTVSDADIITSACGLGCTSIGIASIYTDSLIQRVDILDDSAQLNPPDVLVGMMLLGGSPRITGDESRGRITLNSAVAGEALGLVASKNGDLQIEGITIAGGIAPLLVGLSLVDSMATVGDTNIELNSFGSMLMQGVSVTSCPIPGSSELPVCSCASWYTGCPEEEASALDTTAADLSELSINLAATSSPLTVPPCAGVGVGIEKTGTSVSVRQSSIQVGSGFSIAAGASASAANELVMLDNPHIVVGNSERNELCSYFDLLGNDDGDTAGSAGALVSDAVSLTAQGNHFSVGTSAGWVVGLMAANVGAVEIHQNELDISTATDGTGSGDPFQSTTEATGIFVQDPGTLDTPARDVSVTRNRVRVGERALSGVGLAIQQGRPLELGAVESSMHLEVSNNALLIDGGMHAIGLAFVMFSADLAADSYPRILHNTAVVDAALTNRGIAWTNLSESSLGSFQNNLVAIGARALRTYGLDNVGPLWNAAAANVLQRSASASQLAPVAIGRTVEREGSTHGLAQVLFNDGDLVLYAEDGGGGLREVTMERSPLKPRCAAAVSIEGAHLVVAGLEQGIALSAAGPGGPKPFKTIPLPGRMPKAVSAIPDKEYLQSSQVFIEDTENDETDGLWLVRSTRSGAYGQAVQVLSVPDPDAVACDPVSGACVVSAGSQVHAYGGDLNGRTLTLPTSSPATALLFEQLISLDPVELVTLVDGEVTVFRDVQSSTLGTPVTFTAEPCDGAKATALAIQPRGLLAKAQLVVGCDNGQVDLFEQADLGYRLERVETFSPTLSAGPVSNVIVASDYVVAAHSNAGTNGDVVRIVSYGKGAGPESTTDVISNAAGRDTAWQPADAATFHAAFTYDDSHLSFPETLVCQLTEDLHLDFEGDGGGLCVDAGVDAGIGADIDGCNARDTNPDIGADELDATGTACEGQ